MRHRILLLTAAATVPAMAFANPKTTKPAETPAPTTATETTNGRTAPVLTPVRNDIPMPARAPRRGGSKPLFDFDSLTEIGQSFGVKDRTAKSMSSVVHTQNKKFVTSLDDGQGGTKTIRSKQFEAFDVDAGTDPDGASVRIFRIEPENK